MGKRTLPRLNHRTSVCRSKSLSSAPIFLHRISNSRGCKGLVLIKLTNFTAMSSTFLTLFLPLHVPVDYFYSIALYETKLNHRFGVQKIIFRAKKDFEIHLQYVPIWKHWRVAAKKLKNKEHVCKLFFYFLFKITSRMHCGTHPHTYFLSQHIFLFEARFLLLVLSVRKLI